MTRSDYLKRGRPLHSITVGEMCRLDMARDARLNDRHADEVDESDFERAAPKNFQDPTNEGARR